MRPALTQLARSRLHSHLDSRKVQPVQLLDGIRILLNGTAPPMPKQAFYAVSAGRAPGIYKTWGEAEAQVKGFKGARYKKFDSEAGAKNFITPGSGGASTSTPYARPTAGSSSRLSRTAKTGSLGKNRTSNPTRADSPPSSARVGVEDLSPRLVELAAKGYTFGRSPPHRLVVYTDGSSLGNGQRGAAAGAGVFWGGTGEAYKNNLGERVPGDPQTNNRGELYSIVRALEKCPYPDLPLEIRTDSQYSISCLTVYLPKWIKNGWRTAAGDVKNADMIRHILVLLRRRDPRAPVKFKHVKGHAGHEGNEAADGLARLGAMAPAEVQRTDWFDLDAVDTPPKRTVNVDAEMDPSWLMNEDEMAEFEEELAA